MYQTQYNVYAFTAYKQAIGENWSYDPLTDI